MSTENSNALQVKVATKTSDDGQTWWEGTVSLEGVKPTKLARKSDGNVRFATRSALVGAARRFAERHAYSDVTLDEKAKKAEKAEKAPKAKKADLSATTA